MSQGLIKHIVSRGLYLRCNLAALDPMTLSWQNFGAPQISAMVENLIREYAWPSGKHIESRTRLENAKDSCESWPSFYVVGNPYTLFFDYPFRQMVTLSATDLPASSQPRSFLSRKRQNSLILRNSFLESRYCHAYSCCLP